MYKITFLRKGREHSVRTDNVEKALNGRYGLLVGKTGHLNKVTEIVKVK